LDELSERCYGALWYFSLKVDLNSDDNKSAAIVTKYEQRLAEAGNKTKFFGLDIAKIPTGEHRTFLNYPGLKPYKYALQIAFANAKHRLSEGEEQLLSLLSQPGYRMWIDTQEKLLNQQTVIHKGKILPITEAKSLVSELPKKDRRELHNKIRAVYKSISHIAEGEINAIYNYKKIVDKRRGYKNPYSSTILNYENDEKSIENLVSLVTNSFKISHRFYKLHAKLLGEDKLNMADRNVKVGKIKTKFDFTKSVSILRSTLASVDNEYQNILDSFLENGQIDVYPKKGKRGGAYSSSIGKLPGFILLNHVDSIKSLKTLAHEMGHSIHSEMSKSQPSRYRDYSISTAEVASTFFEQLISEEVEKVLSDKERIVFIHSNIQEDIATIFLQIAFFNFELELHNKIRKEGQISKEDMAKLMQKHLQSYVGDTIDVSVDDGYSFVALMHMRRFFYVYSYAYGQIISRALYEKWKEDHSYAKKIKQFLSAGSSMSPEDIFKSIGVDTSKTEFFEAGLKSIENDIIKLEKLSKSIVSR